MPFADIVGHVHQLETLRLALASGRLHHAYLFVGPEGVGKRTVALALAKAVHCGEVDNDFCDRCVNCGRISSANHADVRLVTPLPGKKEITIQQIRDVEKELSFRSFSGPRKIMIIDPASLMNVSAQNALLKTLEEPPKNSLLILIAPNGGSLLPTVRSRCLRVAFAPLTGDVLAGYLTARRGADPEAARLAAAVSMGSLGAAINLDDQALLATRQRWMESLSSLRRGDYRGAFSTADAFSENREESLKFLEWLESWYRDLMVHRITGETADLINLDLLSPVMEQSRQLELADILEVLRLARGAAARIQRNLNRRMILEDVFVRAVKER